MRTTIESLSSAKQVLKEGRTYIKDCDCTILRINDFGYKFYVIKHGDLNASASFKTFRAAWNYVYIK